MSLLHQSEITQEKLEGFSYPQPSHKAPKVAHTTFHSCVFERTTVLDYGTTACCSGEDLVYNAFRVDGPPLFLVSSSQQRSVNYGTTNFYEYLALDNGMSPT